ncbi:hypothetical protein ERD78_19260 [Allopusillimonas soli]|uniref:Uncharacterized protein n=1 Tax=Allopusillimonas soli TaxID=659016 RepID=A0A853FGZ4_9BURK|nr:hypothetical protein [Allopusillimonas soli]NYT38998.1 hypothetical protein [Allopusillimonas soli]TEA69561.1 hypothetical protein ERD78_19260 [Allopusillimonas soli]
MKPLSLHARQMNQRRVTAFYLSPERPAPDDGQSDMKHFRPHEDRPRSLREMFSDEEIDGDEETGV